MERLWISYDLRERFGLGNYLNLLVSYASVAQLVEHLHGKEGVIGSSPIGGFKGENSLLPLDPWGENCIYSKFYKLPDE